jgi:hypothetical protein
MSPGRRGFTQNTSNRAVHILGPFQGQNCTNKELVKSRYSICAVSYSCTASFTGQIFCHTVNSRWVTTGFVFHIQ